MVVMPLTLSAETGLAQISVPRFSRREGVADPDRNVARDRRLHGLRMDDLGAEVGELHGLVVGELVDHLGVRHQARIGRQHAVDVGPDDDLGSLQQRAEDGSGKIAAVASERGLHAARRGRDEAGHDEPSAKALGHAAAAGCARSPPIAPPGRAGPIRR